MENKLVIGGWQGSLDAELPRGQLEAVLHAANDLTVKQIARNIGINPDSVQGRLDRAKDKLGFVRSLRGLVLEAMKRGIIAPLVIMLAMGGISFTSSPQPPRTPQRPARVLMVRRIESVTI